MNPDVVKFLWSFKLGKFSLRARNALVILVTQVCQACREFSQMSQGDGLRFRVVS